MIAHAFESGRRVYGHTRKLHIAFVTTASIPWLTGPSVNATMRAATFAERGFECTLILPWVAKRSAQQRLFGRGTYFQSPAEQELAVRSFLRDNGADHRINIAFYRATYDQHANSLYPASLRGLVSGDFDAVILEEAPILALAPRLSRKTRRPVTIGLLSTNYAAYISPRLAARPRSPRDFAAKVIIAIMHRLLPFRCDAIVALSPVLRLSPDYRVAPVNGVRQAFFRNDTRTRGAYFIGKLAREKGLAELFAALGMVSGSSLDIYGSGPDEQMLKLVAFQSRAPVNFLGLLEKPWESLGHYRLFVNPSRSEVLCTTTAEALALGQTVIAPDHPSNSFFKRFPRFLVYQDQTQLIALLRETLTQPVRHDPGPIAELSWSAATDRLIDIIEQARSRRSR